MPRPYGLWRGVALAIYPKPIGHHIHDRAQVRLCDGTPASDADISSEDWSELREARRDATLCPDCQDKVDPRDVKSDLYGMGRHSTAYLYAVPALAGFDAVRNCSHCRKNTDEDCAAWRKLRKAVAVLRRECRWYVKGVGELLDATGSRPATIYEFACGSVAYFAPDAPDFCEAGELKGVVLAAASVSSMSGAFLVGSWVDYTIPAVPRLMHLVEARHDPPGTAHGKRSGHSDGRAASGTITVDFIACTLYVL